MADLKYYLRARQIWLRDSDTMQRQDEAGDFLLVPVEPGRQSLAEIKQICEDFEESHPFGRFIDVDVTDADGNAVSSGKSKLCFFCGNRPAIMCRRDNTHGLNDLRAYMFSNMGKYCLRQREDDICRMISSLALRAILYEISLTPKPGLVDKFRTGSHADMDYLTFIDSSSAISGYFTDLVHAGFAYTGENLADALPVVRDTGLRMEAVMFSATRQVNTQKGIIFLMGLSLFACGYLFAHGETFSAEMFRDLVMRICHDITGRELSTHDGEPTHGREIYDRHRITGARGEAEKGFPMVFEFGLPVLLSGKQLDDDILLRTFLSIAAHNDDTNILYRSNPDVLVKFKALCTSALDHFSAENLSLVAEFCKNENISPGGSADLLAMSIFTYFVMHIREKYELDFLLKNYE
jgi:holo-ACP synthase / triphosphoribosyl-dephospho-CoA synthase